jgi:hypothetical protein
VEAQTTTNTATLDRCWQPSAAGANTNPRPFYGSHHPQTQLCAGCVAAEPCLWAAMALEQAVGYRYGLWGATTARRRQRIAASLPAETDYTAWYGSVVTGWARTGPNAGHPGRNGGSGSTGSPARTGSPTGPKCGSCCWRSGPMSRVMKISP